MNASDTEKDIQSRRAVMRPTPVRLNHVPDWFRRALLRGFGCDRGNTGGWSVLYHAAAIAGSGSTHWLDHHGSTTIGKVTAFVTEPYQLSAADLRAVAMLAGGAGCQWRLSANSWWFPGGTLRVVFEPTEASR